MSRKKDLTQLEKSARNDGWENLLTGVGDWARDKRQSATARSCPVSHEEAREIYRGDFMGARVVDLIAEEMTRKWLEVVVESDTDAGETLDLELRRLKAKAKVTQALKWRRVYGGGGILLGVNDGQEDLTKPLDEARIRTLDYLTTFDARELHVLYYYSNPLADNFGEPEIYRINPRALGIASIGVVDVHESRILRFSGPIASREQLLFNQGWGDSIYVRIREALRDFAQGYGGAAALLQDFSQAIFKIRGLADAIAGDREGMVIKRMKLMDLSRSMLRAMVLDAEGEDFERKPTPISGLAEVLDRLGNLISSATDIPVPLLMGEAPAGLNATGDANIRFFYDKISSWQTADMCPQVERLITIICLAQRGPMKGIEPDNWSVKLLPLWQLDDMQEATRRKDNATADQIYMAAGVVTPDEIRESRFGGDQYGSEIQLDEEARAAFEAAQALPPGEGDDPLNLRDPNATDPKSPANVNPKKNPSDPAANSAPTKNEGQAAAGKPAMQAAGAPRGQFMRMISGPPGDNNPQKQHQAFNGGQISQALEIVQAVAREQVPADSGIAMLTHLFSIQPEQAQAILSGAGKSFKAKQEPQPTPGGAPGDKKNKTKE